MQKPSPSLVPPATVLDTMLRVLFVEDSPSDAELISFQLKKAGYRVISERVETASAMKAALERLTFDLVIADYSLPDFNAIAALQVLQATDLDLPFIVISGTIPEETAIALMRAGAHDYLMKDHLARLGPAVQRELDEATMRQGRRQMEEDLEESKQLFNLLIESLPQNIYAKDLNGRFIFANQNYCSTQSKKLEEIVGKTDMELHPPFMAEKYQKDDRWVIETGQTIEMEEEHQPLNQEKTYVQVIKAPLYDAKRQIAGTLGIFWDITGRKRMEEALVAERNLLRTLIDNLPDRIYVKDLQGRKTLANIADSQVSGGRNSGDVIGKQDSAMYPPELAAQYAADDRSVLDLGIPIVNREEPGLDENGKPAWILSTKVPLRNGQGNITGMVGIGRDITERKQHELESVVIASVSSALRLAATRTDMLPIILDQVSLLVGTSQASLILFDDTTNCYIIEEAHGDWADSQHTRLLLPEPILKHMITEGQPYLCEDTDQDRFLCETFSMHRSQMIVAIPLIANQQTIGILCVGRYKDDPSNHMFNEGEVRQLSAIADIAANAINRTNLYEESQRVAIDLMHAYDSTLEGWAHALELRDQETEGHTRRVAHTTVELAQALGFDQGILEQVRRGALLHDIGKMGIPDSVLLKPGTLNEREWEIMRRHPEYAHDLLTPIEYLRPALDIPYCHHEKWDGTGYPRGLKGNEIPLMARIFAIVDVWDALTSDRPYRKAWSEEKALEYIREQSGIHFDPQVAAAFLKIVESKEGALAQKE
jgi:PAS domain S-box-containing protein